jgi:hypothetical protein
VPSWFANAAFSNSEKTPMEVSHQRKERFYLKLLFGTLIAIFLLIGLFWTGHDLYARWQEKRLVRRAVYAIQHGDDATASLAARTVLQIKPASAPAARIVAELAEKAGNRVALDWRHKLVDLEPDSVDDALAWARCALQFGDIAIAKRALGKIDEPGRRRAGYHAVSALLAQAEKHDDKAESEWAQAVEIEPNEKAYQLQLGILRLRAKEEDRHAAGKAMLMTLRDDPKQRLAATHALINDGIARHANTQELIDLARDLQSYPEATVSERLIFLDFLHQAQLPQFSAYLTELETNVAARPADLAAVLEWMSQSNLNLLALDFIKSLPRDTLEKWPVLLAVADLYARLKDWHKLETLTRDANWREGDFMRHAYLARALRAQDKTAAAEREWAAATKAASSRNESVVALVRTTTEWKWDKEMVDLLWSLTNDPEKQTDAVQSLYRYYSHSKDTQGLYRVLVRWADLAPDDLNVQNNLAQVSLLLNANLGEARRIAADVYQKMPSNAAYVTTYAFSLLSKGNPTEAAKVMGSLTEEQLRDPAVSTYYGICLAALHDEKGRQFLETGQQAILLPEEKKLVDKALASLSTRQTTN